MRNLLARKCKDGRSVIENELVEHLPKSAICVPGHVSTVGISSLGKNEVLVYPGGELEAYRREHVFGLSLGAMVPTWLALDAPARVESLMLASLLPPCSAISPRLQRHLVPMLKANLRTRSEMEVGPVHEILSEPFRLEHPERERTVSTHSKRRRAGTASTVGQLSQNDGALHHIGARAPLSLWIQAAFVKLGTAWLMLHWGRACSRLQSRS